MRRASGRLWPALIGILAVRLLACREEAPAHEAADVSSDAAPAADTADTLTPDGADGAAPDNEPDAADLPEHASDAAEEVLPSPDLGDTPAEEPEPTPEPDPVLVVSAGDIANCSILGYAGLVRDPHELTADLVREYPDDTPVLTLGDHVYSDGTSLEFATCYEKGWGAFRDRTHPCPGNHDYNTDDAEPYYEYFGARAGPSQRGYYSFELGDWHVMSLNSNCDEVDCGPDSEQLSWLRADLADHPTHCSLAFWHVPIWSSDRTGNSESMAAFVDVLDAAGVDLILVGHAHNYERLARMTPDGQPDAERGIRQLVVGTGGAELREMELEHPNSEVFLSTFGILELSLYRDRYAWRFRTLEGEVGDAGEDPCHDP